MPGFDSELLDLLQFAYNRAIAKLSPSDVIIGEHICEVVAQAVLASASQGTVDVDHVINHATIAGRQLLQAERFLPTAA